jgi:hypothetical protein
VKYCKIDDNKYLIYLGTTDAHERKNITPKTGRVTLINLFIDQEQLQFNPLQSVEMGGSVLDIEILRHSIGLECVLFGVNSFVNFYDLAEKLANTVTTIEQ